MRHGASVRASLVLAAALTLASGCTAILPFSFGERPDDAGADLAQPDLLDADLAGDLAGADLSGPLGAVGDACNTLQPCRVGLQCRTTVGNDTFPNGFCTRACTGSGGCAAEERCARFSGGEAVCVPRCGPLAGLCRTAEGYECCDITGAPPTGGCAPAASSFCE